MGRYQTALDLLYKASVTNSEPLLVDNEFLRTTVEEAKEVLQELINEVKKCQDVEKV